MRKISFCKNAVLYSYSPSITSDHLVKAMEAATFNECQEHAISSSGFVKEDESPVARIVNGVMHFRFRTDNKLLPSSVVNAELARQIKEIEENEGENSVPRWRRVELKEIIYREMVKKAFIQSHFIQGLVDTKNHVLIVDCPSFAKADILTSTLMGSVKNQTQESLQLKKWQVGTSPGYFMTLWASTGEPPDGFSIDDCAVFEDAKGGKVRVAGKTLYNETIQKLAGQSLCKELAMTYGEDISFQLSESMAIKRIRFIGIRKIDENQADMLQEERDDAEILMMAATVSGLAEVLTKMFGGNPNIETA